MPYSLTAAVGFMALAGVAVLNGMVSGTYFNQRCEVVKDCSPPPGKDRGRACVPCGWRLATVVLGGMVGSTLLTLLLLPVLHAALEGKWRVGKPAARSQRSFGNNDAAVACVLRRNTLSALQT